MMISYIVFIAVIIISSIGIDLGYDPVWFCMLVIAGAACAYLITMAPYHLTWWVIGLLAGV